MYKYPRKSSESVNIKMQIEGRGYKPITKQSSRRRKIHSKMRRSVRNIVVVLCPYPAMGHIKPMLVLARLLSCPSQIILNDNVYTIRIELVCTEFYSQRILESWANTESEVLRIHTLPDGLPSTFDRTIPSTQISEAIAKLGPIFESLLRQLILLDDNNDAAHVSTHRILVYDGFLPWAHDAATKLCIPCVLFWTQSASVLAIFSNLQHFIARGFDPFRVDAPESGEAAAEEWCSLNIMHGIPASALPFRVLPDSGGADRRFLLSKSLEAQRRQWTHVSCAIIHTIPEMEPPQALKSLRSAIGPVPLQLLGPLVGGGGGEDGDNLVAWLDSRRPASVLYISMGSVVGWEAGEAAEVAKALMELRQEFVWVMRPWGRVREMPGEAMKLGKFVRWAPQLQVLRHRAIAAFFTHAGWNSTMESVACGVPVLAWPHFLDQFTNAWLLEHHWRLGLTILHVNVHVPPPLINLQHHDHPPPHLLQQQQQVDGPSIINGRHHRYLSSLLSRILHDGPERRRFLSSGARLKQQAAAAAASNGDWRREFWRVIMRSILHPMSPSGGPLLTTHEDKLDDYPSSSSPMSAVH